MPRAPPSTAIEPAPPAAFASVISSAAASSAAFHVVGCSSSPTRTSGVAESILAVDGLEVEPAPVAQPAPVDRIAVDALIAQQFVVARLHDVRQPTAQVVQVLSVCSRSHGRALNRYGLAVSAPTGQICTVLPLK